MPFPKFSFTLLVFIFVAASLSPTCGRVTSPTHNSKILQRSSSNSGNSGEGTTTPAECSLDTCRCSRERVAHCGSDGQTYDNLCMLNCARAKCPGKQSLRKQKLGECNPSSSSPINIGPLPGLTGSGSQPGQHIGNGQVGSSDQEGPIIVDLEQPEDNVVVRPHHTDRKPKKHSKPVTKVTKKNRRPSLSSSSSSDENEEENRLRIIDY